MAYTDLEPKLGGLKINGFCIFADLLPCDKIDRIRTDLGRRPELEAYTMWVPGSDPKRLSD